MIDSPWSATVLRQHKTDTIVSELMLAMASGNGVVPEGDDLFFVTAYADKVPVFNLPITRVELGDRRVANPDAVYLDARSFSKKDMNRPGEFVVNNATQYDFIARVGELTAFWLKNPDNRLDVLRAGDISAQVYISWLSYAIANKLGLDEDTARTLQILSGIFYAHLYHGADEALSDRGKTKIAALVTRWTRAPAEMVLEQVQNVSYMNLLGDYVEEVKRTFSQNTRVDQVNVGFIIRALTNSWFGFGAQDIVAVAKEYPPVFVALIEAALNSRLWKKSQLGKLVERFDRGTTGKEFSKNLSVLVGRNNYPDAR
jgi:hypothetical protein